VKHRSTSTFGAILAVLASQRRKGKRKGSGGEESQCGIPVE